jgi:RHS repeat-associated protein
MTQPNQNPNNLGTFTFNQRFPGQVFDSESGLFQNHHREYQALKGGYLTPDPIGLAGGSMSLYTYVESQPTRMVDPQGLKGSCTASCNVQQIKPDVCCPDRVTGAAIGPNEPAACVAAKRNATQSTPAGCYPRHCQCDCSKK